ncbi:phage tail protein [Pedobacter sp. MC2016-24]|uniref:phage tail protein n=1 Tax=Pedobacter sp. MC2016-24 TaxID=2780090 RepID=UPI0018829FC4|nr:tail fiber protein [Pedobacter sp. MC2016-24]MBE9601763.1 tail fiber protein [Pedobacter sp. MC2016-24]
MEGTIGEIRIFAANYAPRDWAFCQGQIIQIRNNTALFSILGTTYGGNGTTTFMLPDFRGRVALGVGQLPGGSDFVLGQASGAEVHTLSLAEMAAHTHVGTVSGSASLMVSSADSTLAVATAGSVISSPGYTATGGLAKTLGFNNATPNVPLHSDSVKVSPTPLTLAAAGGNAAHNNMQPYLALNHIICMYGIFPSRN